MTPALSAITSAAFLVAVGMTPVSAKDLILAQSDDALSLQEMNCISNNNENNIPCPTDDAAVGDVTAGTGAPEADDTLSLQEMNCVSNNNENNIPCPTDEATTGSVTQVDPNANDDLSLQEMNCVSNNNENNIPCPTEQ